MARPSKDLRALAALFATSGSLHLLWPQTFETMVPIQAGAAKLDSGECVDRQPISSGVSGASLPRP